MNHDQVINLINQHNSLFTVHAFGIGTAVSTELVAEAAGAGRGQHYFVNNSADGLKACVIETLNVGMGQTYLVKDRSLDI